MENRLVKDCGFSSGTVGILTTTSVLQAVSEEGKEE